MEKNSYKLLTDELSHWQDAGLQCLFWWRDDDLISTSPKLHRMRQVSEQYVVYVLVAVVPDLMVSTLGCDTSGMHTFVWCQHGFAHVNHEGANLPNSEFPFSRERELVIQDLTKGRKLLLDQFSDRLFPVLVPPWNGFRDDLVKELPALGLTGISQYGSISRQKIGQALRIDTHLDVVDWSSAPKFSSAQEGLLLDRLIENLRIRRLDYSTDNLIGILTHHRAMDEEAWKFVDELLLITHQFPCVKWVSPRDLFRCSALFA